MEKSLSQAVVALFIGTLLTPFISGCGGHLVNNPAVAYSYLVSGDPQIVSHWSMNETTGTTVADTKGQNPATVYAGSSAPGLQLGVAGPLFGWTNYAISFTPNSQTSAPPQSLVDTGALVVPFSESMKLTDALSMEVWMTAPATQTSYAKVMWMGVNSPTYAQGPWGYEFDQTTGLFLFHLALDTQGDGIARDMKAVMTVPIADGHWHHVVSVFDSTAATLSECIRVYVDGKRDNLSFKYFNYLGPGGMGPFPLNPTDPCAGSIIPASMYDGTHGLVFGAAWNGGNLQQFFNGTFGNMAFYKGPLSDEQVLNHYNQGVQGHP